MVKEEYIAAKGLMMKNNGYYSITYKPIDVHEIIQKLIDEKIGAIATFIGIVREKTDEFAVEKLFYDAHQILAEKSLREIGKQCFEKWKINKIIMIHRIGEVKKGEISVLIAVSAEHRKDAFEACQFAIEELKKNTPIWKKEIGPNESRWI